MIYDIIRLIRPKQWYKNLLVFLPLIFSGNLTNPTAIIQSITAFASFCALSSATYVINDYADKHRDRQNPEKKDRPIASGKIKTLPALTIIILLTTIGFAIALTLPITFVYATLAYYTLSQIYTAWLKHEPFADILIIAINFVIRATAGALAIQVWISPWLILGTFFLALFLILGKRKSEQILLKDKAQLHRKTLKAYTPEITTTLSTIATTALVVCYTLYVFFGEHQLLYLNLPAALYAVFRYESIINTGNKIARHPENAFTDTRLMTAMIIWGIITIAALYW